MCASDGGRAEARSLPDCNGWVLASVDNEWEVAYKAVRNSMGGRVSPGGSSDVRFLCNTALAQLPPLKVGHH
jgi:hypothetical protein